MLSREERDRLFALQGEVLTAFGELEGMAEQCIWAYFATSEKTLFLSVVCSRLTARAKFEILVELIDHAELLAFDPAIGRELQRANTVRNELAHSSLTLDPATMDFSNDELVSIANARWAYGRRTRKGYVFTSVDQARLKSHLDEMNSLNLRLLRLSVGIIALREVRDAKEAIRQFDRDNNFRIGL